MQLSEFEKKIITRNQNELKKYAQEVKILQEKMSDLRNQNREIKDREDKYEYAACK